MLPRVRESVGLDRPVLSRSDSGFDSAQWLFQPDDEKRAWAAASQIFEYLVKWKPRRQDLAAWVARAEGAHAFQETRPSKRVALLDLRIERAWQKEKRDFRLLVRVTERTIDRHGAPSAAAGREPGRLADQPPRSPQQVIDRYVKRGLHEQFHSDIKTDLAPERLPSGKFDCNDLIPHLGMFAFNGLRLRGQLGLTGEPARHPAKGHRLKTVLRELMDRAAEFIRKARQRMLDLGRACRVVAMFRAVQEDLLTSGRSP